MKTGRKWMVAGALALAASAGLPGHASAIGSGGDVDVLSQRGFGSHANGYAWGMTWFKGKLYVGTGRQVACVESYTRAYFLPLLQPYVNNPSVNVRCPKNPFDMHLQAEIWSWAPKSGKWTRVYRAPAEKIPGKKGKVTGRDIAYRGLAVRTDDRGRQSLWASGVTSNEYLPKLKESAPPRLLHSSDGRHFRAVTPSAKYTVTTLTGKQKPIGFRGIQFLGDRMYALASTAYTGDGAVVEVINPESRHPRFRQVSPKNVAVFELQTYRKRLWIGTGDSRFGYGVYRSRYTRPRSGAWSAYVTRGAGRGVRLTSVVSMHVFKGDLFIGSTGWTNEERTLPSTEVIKMKPDGTWDIAVGNARNYDGEMKFPVSGLNDGWGSNFTAHPWRMADQGGTLYAGTNDFSSTLINQGFPLVQQVLAPGYGFDIWATCDGDYWFPVTRNAYNGNPMDFGARTIVKTPYGLAVGSADHALGTTITLDRRNACGTGGNISPRRRLSGLDADAQRNGTVVSWAGSTAGQHFRVLRAELPSIEVSLKGPDALPSGFVPETSVPKLVADGTPGSQKVDLLGMGNFSSVGTSTSDHWVDTTAQPGKKYAYRVVAVDAQGRQTGATGVQTVNDGARQVTPATVARTIGEETNAPVSHAAGATPSLAELKRAARGNADLTALVERLERRQRYAKAAGGR